MATSSLFHLFRIEGDEAVTRFLDAYEDSMRAEPPKPTCNVKMLNDPEEIEEFMQRARKRFETKELEEQRLEAAS